MQRQGNLSYARLQLDKLYADYENNIPLQRSVFRTSVAIPTNDFFDAYDIYKHLKNKSDEILVRVGTYHRLVIYANDKEFLTKLGKKLRSIDIEFWEPNLQTQEFLLNNLDTVLVKNKPKNQIRVILGRKKGSQELANWLVNNQDKSKVGQRTLEHLKNNGYVNGLYFYVRDEKILHLITLICGNNIRKVERLVWNQEIDKY